MIKYQAFFATGDSDPLTHRGYEQTFVYKWHGAKEHKSYPDLMHIRNEETIKALRYLEKDLAEFKSVPSSQSTRPGISPARF